MTNNDGESFFLDDDEPRALDFRRAGGAPLVRSVGGERWERYSRPSGFGEDLDDEYNLWNWKIDRAIEGVATTPSLAAEIATHIGRSQGRKDRREKAISVGRGEEAADLGTALHAMAHRLETDDGFRAPPPYDADLAAYLMALDEAGLESTDFEVHLCSDAWRAAGTADRIYRARRELQLPDGSRLVPGTSIIGDLKTGKRLDYALPGFSIQVAIYVDSVFYDVVTDERTPLPDNLHTGYGLLVHLPVGQAECTFHWLDLQVGRIGAALVHQVREWRKRGDWSAPFEFPTSDEVAVFMSPIYDLENEARASVALDGDTQSDEVVPQDIEDTGAWAAAMMPWIQARINAIGSHSDARAMLLRRWPSDIPPPRDEELDTQQVSRVLDFLCTIEAAYSLPFCEGDPRVEWDRGLHHKEVQHNNEPRSNVE